MLGGRGCWKKTPDIPKSLAPLHSWQRLYKYATWTIQQVCFTLQGQDAQTVLMSPGDWHRWWDRQQQLSHSCLFRSISVTGQPGLPFIHRRGEVGQNQTRSKQDCLEKILPSLASQLRFAKVFIQVHIAEVVLLLHGKLRMKTSVSKDYPINCQYLKQFQR